MNDLNHIFHTANLHFAARAARGRIEAINAAPNLHWVVEVQNGEGTLHLEFDTAPSFMHIVQRFRTLGLWGDVNVRSIKVARKRKRPLLLMPWQRTRAAVVTATATPPHPHA